MANPKMNIGVQVSIKTGTIILTAPDGELYPVKAGDDNDKTAQALGKQILELYMDPEQRAEAAAARQVAARAADHYAGNGATQVHPVNGANMTEAEVHLRKAMDSAIPGASNFLSWLQELSAHNAEGDG